MPYNNTPISRSTEVTGTVSLPLARVKKIVNADPDVNQCSNNAAFMITVATEMFLQHLVEHSYNQVRTENVQKPRRNIQYRDVANAVARVETLEFLTDVVPKAMTFKQAKQKQTKDVSTSVFFTNGQDTLDSHMAGKEQQATNGASHDAMDVDNGERSVASDKEDVMDGA